jgi:hypothetical protein
MADKGGKGGQMISPLNAPKPAGAPGGDTASLPVPTPKDPLGHLPSGGKK